MTSAFPSRPPTNGNIFGQLNRQASASSFPSTIRTTSNSSLRNGSPLNTRPFAHREPSVDQSQTSSTPSSVNQPQLPVETIRSRVRLKSQYPADSAEKHVEYIMVASFDIDRGPIMEHQYPGAISGDENMLAELMLPDQAHVRAQDWTLFFLHKDAEVEDESEEEVESKGGDNESDGEVQSQQNDADPADDRNRDAGEGEDAEGGEGPPLIYVLNLVNMKHDSSVKRGAIVKAMAVCTRHPFLHIYKPLLILALEEYFRAPFPETLETLYDALNAMDLSLMPKLSVLERQILQASERKDMFLEKFEMMAYQRIEEAARSTTTTSPESLPLAQLEIAKRIPPNVLPRDTHELESRVTYNNKPIPIKVPTSISAETVGDFSLIRLVQIFSSPHASSPQPFALHPHLTTSGAYTHPIIVLVNAVLTQKRIIFLGHNRPSGEVADIVLAACALASGGVLRGFTRHAFPYTDLTKIDELLNVPGFIAGVTNPAFSHHPEWWDLMCDIPTGRMKISNKIEPAPATDGLVNFQSQNPMFVAAMANGSQSGNSDPTDASFIEDLLKGIAARHGETAIRAKWRGYMTRFTRIAAAFEEAVYGASALYVGAHEADAGLHGVKGHGYVWPDSQARAKDLAANVYRIEGWRNTRSYYAFIQDLAALWERRPIRSIDLAYQHDRLRSHKLNHQESGAIYLAFAATVNSYDEICQFLTVTPEQKAGLFYISLGLFHPGRQVREAIVGLLDRIKAHDAGRHFWSQVGRFAKLAFSRIKQDMEKRNEEEISPSDENGMDTRIRGTHRVS